MPTGKAILFPILNVECSYAEFPGINTEQDLRNCAHYYNVLLKVSIDGVNLNDPNKFYVQSPIFDVVFPENNLFSAPAGPTKAVSEGWWIILQPLPPGRHHIYLSGSALDDNPTTGLGNNIVSQVNYNLNVR